MTQLVSLPSRSEPGARWTGPAVQRFILAAFAIGALVEYAATFLPVLVTAQGNLGADYSYFLPQLLAGYYWFHENGLFAVPWFTPAFCGGLPHFPNIQGTYYSVPQILTFGVGPVWAVALTFIGFAAAGYWGAYRLLRHNFAVTGWSATAGATLFLFNGFYSAHLLIGHLTFHAFMLVPWLAVFALSGVPERDRPRPIDLPVLGGALVVAYMIYSGMVHALPPSLLALVAVWLLHGLLFGVSARPFIRLVAMTVLAMVLSSAKLVAGFAYLSNFPRDMIPIAGFGELWQVIFVAFAATSLAPPVAQAHQWLVNTEWGDGFRIVLSNHELDFRITVLPVLLIVAWLIRALVRIARRRAVAVPHWKLAVGFAFAAIVVLPIFLVWYQPDWTAFLKSLPVLRNSSVLVRWFCVFVVVGFVATALIVDRAPMPAPTRALLGGVIAATVMFTNALIERKYEAWTTDFPSHRIEAAYRAVTSGGSVPRITHIVTPDDEPEDLGKARDRNEYMANGGSSAQCYEPMFGYLMEQFPRGPLVAGPTLSARNGILNVKNPACMVYPDANGCRPGDHFTVAQAHAAQSFISYRPFDFVLPWWQTIANWTSLAALAATLAVLGAACFRRTTGRRKRQMTPVRTDAVAADRASI